MQQAHRALLTMTTVVQAMTIGHLVYPLKYTLYLKSIALIDMYTQLIYSTFY